MNPLAHEKEQDGLSLIPVRWLATLAGVSGLIGIVGLIALMSQGAWGAPGDSTPPTGFPPGQRAFNNPFAGGAPADNGEFLPDEDEADDGGDSPSPGNPGSNASLPKGASARGGGVSVGGSPGGGIVEHNDIAALNVDTETGVGSKEVVTDFNFPDADIMDIAKALGKLTGKNFILDKDVKGRVTIISNSPITVADAWKAFLTALDMNGFALIPSGKYVRIARQRDARDKQLKTYTGSYAPNTDALITRLFPLKYLSAEEVARNFRSFMPANSRIIPYEQTNTVIVTDTGSNITKLQKLLDILDVEGYDAGIEVIAVKHASAADLAKLIDSLVPGTAPVPGRPAARTTSRGGGSFQARKTKEGGIINNIIADERTNTLIIHANNRGADEIRQLVAKLDRTVPVAQGGGKVHVVYLQFADAEQIAQTLNNLSQSAGAPPRGGGPGGRPGGGTGVNPVQASLFEGQIRISPDKSTNSLVVTASPSDFSTMQRVINRLDIPRDQVYAEVIIMELNLGRDFKYSSNVVNPKNGIGINTNADLIGSLTNPIAQKGAVLGFRDGEMSVPSPTGSGTIKIPNLAALITLLQTRSNANILATPQILALDNTDAEFSTSENIPVPTSTAVQGAGVSNSVTKERVQLAIKIKPQINKLANFVKLDIEAQLANIDRRELPAQVQQLAFATLERTAKTSLVVADKDTIVLGGLIRDNTSEQISKVPILGDIPILGWLFKSKESQTSKSNLLIFITPTIIRQYENIRAILDRKLKQRDEFLESNTGGKDPMRSYRDDMIRGLPDVSELKKSVPQRSFTIGNEAAPTETTIGGSVAPLDEGANFPEDGQIPPPPAPEFGQPMPQEFDNGAIPPPEMAPPAFDEGLDG